MFKVTNRNTSKRCLLISKATLKTSERHRLNTSYLREVTVQNHVLDNFSYILQSNICFQFYFQVQRLVISRIVDPYMSFFEKWEVITEMFQSWKIQNVYIFYFWKNSPKNGQIFQHFTLYSNHLSITKPLIFCYILHLEVDFWNLSWKRIVSS